MSTPTELTALHHQKTLILLYGLTEVLADLSTALENPTPYVGDISARADTAEGLARSLHNRITDVLRAARTLENERARDRE